MVVTAGLKQVRPCLFNKASKIMQTKAQSCTAPLWRLHKGRVCDNL